MFIASGSGPQVIASIASADGDQKLLDKLLSIRVAIVKILSSSLMVACGGAVGREGPSIQISTSIFYVFQKTWMNWGYKIKLKNMLVAGGAGGLAAAFNTPLGGIIYAVEELARDHLSNFRIGLLEAVITAGLVAQLINGRYLFLGFPKVIEITPSQYLPLIVIAMSCGFMGAAFGWLLYHAIKIRMQLPIKKQYFVVMLAGVLFSILVFFVSKYSIGSGKTLIAEILFKSRDVEWGDVLSRFFGPILTSLSGAAGGVFAPALAAGAAMGDFVSEVMLLPANNIWTLCGMVAFLTGLTKTPVTSLVLVLEMTDRHSVVFPIMLSALLAQICSRILEKKSFYEKMSDLIQNPS